MGKKFRIKSQTNFWFPFGIEPQIHFLTLSYLFFLDLFFSFTPTYLNLIDPPLPSFLGSRIGISS